jgi:hypothetical protein
MSVASRLIRSYDEKLVLGVTAPADQSTVCAALIKCSGFGYLQQPVVLSHEQNCAGDASEFPAISPTLSERQWLLRGTVERLISSRHCARGLPLVIGLDESPTHDEEPTEPSNNAFLLAEQTGLNVVDSFYGRDVAAGGNGHGTSLIPLWQLLADVNGPATAQPRLLVTESSLSSVAEDFLGWDVIFLPRHSSHQLPPPIQRFQLPSNPADRVLAELCEAIEGWRKTFPIGKVLVMRNANSNDHQDLDFIADFLAETYSTKVATATDTLQLTPAAIHAAVTAVHAALHVEQLEANQPDISGAERPRVLGRLTPGSAFAWRRLLKVMTLKSEKLKPLRQAI